MASSSPPPGLGREARAAPSDELASGESLERVDDDIESGEGLGESLSAAPLRRFPPWLRDPAALTLGACGRTVRGAPALRRPPASRGSQFAAASMMMAAPSFTSSEARIRSWTSWAR